MARIWIMLAILGFCSSVAVAAEGFVRVEQCDGVWWFIDPAGKPFVSMGVNHAGAYVFFGPYNKQATIERYGADLVDAAGNFNPQGAAAQRWAGQILTNLKAWNFSTLGYHTGNWNLLRGCDLYRVAWFSTGDTRAFRPAGTPWPDVFDPKFEQQVETRARQHCRLWRDDRLLLGHGFSDMPAFNRDPIGHPWLKQFQTAGLSSPGKQAWLEILKANYADAHSAAAVYDLQAETWEALGQARQWSQPADETKARADGVEFLTAVADRWIGTHARATRKCDPNHLIFADKIHDPDRIPDRVMQVLGRHADVIMLQIAGRFPDQRETLLRLHRLTGKPIFNGDGSFNVKRPRQTGSKGVKVENFDVLGREYEAYLRGIMSLPFMLGWHYCGYMETWDGFNPRTLNETGFMDPFENTFDDALKHVIPANANAHQWHVQATR